MDRYFSFDMPATSFLRNNLIASVVGLVPLLALYIALNSGFAAHLAGSGLAVKQFLRQILTNGLPVVFLVNYVGFCLFAFSVTRRGDTFVQYMTLLADLILRVALFILLHAVIFVVSADWFGSFGGSRLTALTVVAPTLSRSAYFENLSGVYLYATLVSALPLYVSVLQSAGVPRPFRSLPMWLAALGIFIVLAVLLTLTAQLIMRLQAG